MNGIPLLWRYLIRSYLKVFTLCIFGFIGVLLITRFQSIARFTTTGASKWGIFKFISLQVPFILPLALPISCLIAAFLLFQKMSRSHELTALRVAGLGIFPIIFPLLACGFIFSVANFTLISEIAPKARIFSKNLGFQVTAQNPLSLLQKETLVKLKNTYIDVKHLQSGKRGEDILIIMRNSSNQRLNLALIDQLTLDNQHLVGSGVSFISSVDAKTEAFDHLVIENQKELKVPAENLFQHIKNYQPPISADYLPLRLLRAKYDTEQGTKSHAAVYFELSRRLSLALAPLIFTLVGIVFGCEFSRQHKAKGLLWAVGLVIFYLTAFIAAKSLKQNNMISCLLYLIPHPLIFLYTLRHLKKEVTG